MRRKFKALFPWFNTGFEVWLLAHNVAYLFDRTPFYRPWLSWVGVDLRRLSMDDFVSLTFQLVMLQLSPPGQLAQVKPPAIPSRKSGFLAVVRALLLRSPQLLLDSLRLLLPTAIFFIKFLEWWYSPGSPARSLSISPLGPAIPPPQMLPPHPAGITIDRMAYGHCPLCKGPIHNATALPSGYVFCYRCAHDHVEQHSNCPITLLPAKAWQLRKVLV